MQGRKEGGRKEGGVVGGGAVVGRNKKTKGRSDWEDERERKKT